MGNETRETDKEISRTEITKEGKYTGTQSIKKSEKRQQHVRLTKQLD